MTREALAAKAVRAIAGDSLHGVRPAFYANRVIRLATKDAFAQRYGTDAFALIVIITMQEDAIRYRRAVGFFCNQLLPLLGFAKWERLNRARQTAIEAGWLHFEPGSRSRPGQYRVTIPPDAEGLDDLAIDETTIPFEGYQSGFNAGYQAGWDAARNATTIPFEVHHQGIKSDIIEESKRASIEDQQGAHSNLLPKPQPNPSPSSEWGKMKGELSSIGIKAPQHLIELAQEHGYSVERVREVVAHWRSCPGQWELGAIFHRIENTAADVAAHEGCWPSRPTGKTPSSPHADSLKRFEIDFKRASEPRLIELGRKAGIDPEKLARLSEVGRDATFRGQDRERVLIELAREATELAQANNAANEVRREQAG